jgi:predicted nucleotidyltransferase
MSLMKPSIALRNHREQLREIVARNGALRPRIFGSAIHGDDTDESDLDLLVEPTGSTTLMTLAAIQLEAERLLGVRVDVLTPSSLPLRYRAEVLREAQAL